MTRLNKLANIVQLKYVGAGGGVYFSAPNFFFSRTIALIDFLLVIYAFWGIVFRKDYSYLPIFDLIYLNLGCRILGEQ